MDKKEFFRYLLLAEALILIGGGYTVKRPLADEWSR